MKNFGLDLRKERWEVSEDDWVFGGTSQPCVASIPEEDREKYLPEGEVQRGKEDFMDCSARATNNLLATKFTWLLRNGKLSDQTIEWLYNNGYIIQ